MWVRNKIAMKNKIFFIFFMLFLCFYISWEGGGGDMLGGGHAESIFELKMAV